MKKILTLFAIIVLVTSCGCSESKNKNLTYQNIVILSDMSSRIDNKPPKDINEIHKIIQFFKNECVKPGEKIGDRSSIFFSTFSDKLIASIDMNNFKNLGEKQRFVNSTGEYQNKGLAYQIDNFEQKVKNTYKETRNDGLDLISTLTDKIENDPIIKKNTYLTDGIDTTFVNYDNHVYVFTDGYLEYLNKSSNNQYYFGSSEINNVRQYCVTNNIDINKALEINNSLCLPLSKNSKNKYIHLHVLETHERDKNNKFQIYKYPTGQRDNEILEAVWRKWAIESGFKSFEWKKY